jgi:hypothetical protein
MEAEDDNASARRLDTGDKQDMNAELECAALFASV